MHNISKRIYFETLYMFWTISPSVIRSLKTVHTASGVRHTGSVANSMEFHLVPASKQPQNLYDIYLMLYVQS
jgi:hypothetical protein